MYGDTSVIRAQARAMRERASDMRAEADALLDGAETVPWTGMAADAMRRLARVHAGQLRSCAGAHEDAADALDRHALEVDRVKDLIAAVESRVLGLVQTAGSGLAGFVGQLVPDAVDGWVHDFEPPPHGSSAWLDVRVPGSA